MSQKLLLPALYMFLIVGSVLDSLNPKSASAASFVDGTTLILYDAASGTLPSAPLMTFIAVPLGQTLPTYADGVTIMDTTPSGTNTYAGWIANGSAITGFPILDRSAGFQLNFAIQVEDESHANNSRAGFSVILLGEDARGIELAFWRDEIWAQSDVNTGGLFTHGEGTPFATTTGLTEYQLTIVGDTYSLTASAEPILTGPLRDYSKFEGFPDPYETPSFLFLGDNTTSAESRVRLSLVSITGTEPIIPTAASTSTAPSTPSPPPTDSPIPPPSVTPPPSPTPTAKGIELCPSSGILVMLVAALVMKKIGQVKDPPQIR
jgi:hypothetical protein